MCAIGPNMNVASSFGGALLPSVGQLVTVALANVSAGVLAGIPMPPPGHWQPCPAYPQPPIPPPPGPTPGTPGGGNITGGTPIVPGTPGPSGNVGPIGGSNIGYTAIIGGGRPGPVISPLETAVVFGTLAFVGMDYIIVRVPYRGVCIDLIIPLTSVGMVTVNCLL